MMKEKVCVIGLGYIGLPTASIIANAGYEVVGVDINNSIVEKLNNGYVLIEEPNINEIVKKVVSEGKLRAMLTPETSDIFIITVPTPITKDKKADMSYVIKAAESIVPLLQKGNIVILESTSPVGTTKGLVTEILSESGLEIGKDIFLGYSPERVLPGNIVEELVNNNRIIGGINAESTERIRAFYATFVKGELSLTDSTTAEMCKLVENTYRDVNIALANELAKICEDAGINVWEVIDLSNKHPRVNIHQPGPGVGGHCIAVDPWFIVEKASEITKLIKLSRDINDSMPNYMISRIKQILINIRRRKKITILGITYKPNTSDIRNSPIIQIVDILEKCDYDISIYDPYVEEFRYLEKDIVKACEESDLILLGVNHKEFKYLDFNKLGKVMNNKNILDTRNYLSDNEELLGKFNYYLLGDGVLKA